MNAITQNIKSFRKAKGYSQEFMANKLGVEERTYHSYEKGKTRLTFERIEQIGRILEVETEYLLGYKVPVNPDQEIIEVNRLVTLEKENERLKAENEALRNEVKLQKQVIKLLEEKNK